MPKDAHAPRQTPLSAKPHGNIRLGIDTGGTFTDIVLVGDDGRIAVKKVDNASSNVGDDILNGSLDLLKQAELPPSGVAGRALHDGPG